ncbi:Relaxase/Mobilisation nuclease domain [uncultured Flavonifractor sp.]|nr:Relaxase/Mobilisation nuclease domain [uncultured Flavonifractor sp.]
MATTAIWKVKGNLGRVVGYAANPDKTENPAFTAQDLQGLRDVMDYATQDYKTERQHYVSGVNCAPEIARDEMQMVKQQYGKEGGIIAYHGYQSFAPGEITPEQAHKIGVELARRLWGDRFQVVVATHLDREQIHNHFVLNSVSFVDGKKYNDCKATYALMRQTSDQLCREHGLSVIKKPEQGRTMSRDTWEAEQKGRPTWYGQIRQDVDSCITRSFLFEHFIANLKKQGYEVKTGKYIAVRPPGRERFVRLKTLGDNYTEEAIRQRIRDHERTPLYHRPPPPPRKYYKVRGKPRKLTGFRALYYHYLYLLGKLRKPTAPPKKRRYNMAEVIKLERYVEQAKLLMKYKVDTWDQFYTLAGAIQGEIDALADQRKELYRQKRRDPQIETLSLRIQSINQSIQTYRRELRVCARIEAEAPGIPTKIHGLTPAQEKELKPPAHHRTRTRQR